MSTPEDSNEPVAERTPAVAVPVIALPAVRPRWRKWLFYGLAGFGALALVLVGVTVAVVIHVEHITAPSIERDAQVESTMTSEYGKYSESDKGWLYVEPTTKVTWLMQVVQRAKVELPDTRVKGNTALYFAASGTPLTGANDVRQRLVGLFVIQPDASRADNGLVQISNPYLYIDGLKAIEPQDIRFEALSRDTWGWVLKVPSDFHEENRVMVENKVYAPHDGRIEQLAVFAASGHFDESAGCVTAEAAAKNAADFKVAAAASAALAASAAASDPNGDHEADAYDEEVPTANCQDYAYTYRTGTTPDDGFVAFTVTGGGLVRGEQRPSKTFKLVFDPKSFTYRVPDELVIL